MLSLLLVMGMFAGDNCKAVYGDGNNMFKLATGSPGELGLLKALATEFNSKNNSVMCWVKAGSGKSLKLLKNKKVDIVMVHALKAEKKAVKEGWAIKRTLLGSNEFYIVGPKSDEAKIAQAKSVDEAYSKIYKTQLKFLSRGDNSGTNKKELAIWKKAGLKPANNSWYIITKDFMMATLKKADEEKGYFMTDSSTWIKGKQQLNNLKVLFKGDLMLINTYHALTQPVNGTKAQKLGAKFIDFVSSEEGQNIIRNFGVNEYGTALYNDARYAEQYEH